MKAILFCRVSTSHQEWESQKIELFQAAQNDGFSKDDIIVIGNKESATKLDEEEREGIVEMKRIVEEGGIKTLYVWEISRLSRRDDILFSLKKYLLDRHIQLVCLKPYFRLIAADGQIDPMAEMAFAMYSSFAQMEIRNKNARSRRGKEACATAMKLVGNSVRFGYETDENKIYRPKASEAAIVRKIFDLYLDGNGVQRIQAALKDIGYNLGTQHIRRILTFEGYTGQATLKSGIVRNYPPIIDRDTFDKAQKVRVDNNNWLDMKNKRTYICVPLIKCECGRCYATTGGTGYRCTKSRETKQLEGHSPMIKSSILDDLVSKLAIEAELSFDKEKLQKQKETMAQKIREDERLLIAITEKLAGFAEKESRILDLFIEKQITKEQKNNRLEKLREEKRQLDNKRLSLNEQRYQDIAYLAELEYKQADNRDIVEQHEPIYLYDPEVTTGGKANKKELSPEDKKALAKKHIREIRIFKGKKLNDKIVHIYMKSGVVYEYEVNTRRKTNAIVLLSTRNE